MRNRLYIVHCTLFILLAAVLPSSCGLIELEPDSEARVPTKMRFPVDTVYVFEGDTFQVLPLFEPDTVNNKALVWGSMDEEVVYMQHDTLIAGQEGWARIIVTSVAAMAMDSLDVCVMQPWVLSETLYPYEMVVYADVSVHDQPVTQDMTLAAFSGTSIRGLATPITVGQKTLWRFRIYNDAEFTLPYAETPITFWVYDRKTLQRQMFPTYIIYTGETYGTPSKPIELKI